MSGANETANYRYFRRTMWQVIRSRYVEAFAEAMHSGAPESEARQLAARSVRGDLRAFMSELLTHAPTVAVVAFLEASQQWGEFGERLLEQGDNVLALVDTVEPQAPWPGPAVLDRVAAEDDARWQVWVQTWLNDLKAVEPARGALAGDRPQPESSGAPRPWVRWALGAAAVVGATVVVVLASSVNEERDGRNNENF